MIVKKWTRSLFFIFLFLASVLSADPAPETDSAPPIQVDLLTENATIQPGRPFWVALRLRIQPSWHSYWKNPGDSGFATEVKWQLPQGFKAEAIQWPIPQRFNLDNVTSYGYEGEVWLLAALTPPSSLSDSKVNIGAKVKWLACNEETCLPGRNTPSIELPVQSTPPLLAKEWIDSFQKARKHLPQQPWVINIEREGSLIRLHLKVSPALEGTFESADFFPEEKNILDPSANIYLTPLEGQPGEYVIALKGEDQALQTQTLKGVLVLHNDTSHVSEALEVDAPIHEKGSKDTAISLIDQTASTGKITPADPTPLPEVQASISPFEGGMGLALLLAFIGGTLLNLMPCVLPVISFKILGFVKMAGQDRSLTLQHGLAFSIGVLLSFWVLAGLLIALQAYGHSVGWGFQLQEPLFVAILAAILMVFGLSLFGVFELGTSVTAMAGQAQAHKKGLIGSFFSGILATAVATPCTGPFLGTAVGFAVTLPPILSLLIFTSVGAGMASPYLLLTVFPALLRFLPKPGAWMITFKELMGFLMLGSVLWLAWVFGAQTGYLGIILLLCAFFFLAMGCWVYGRWGTPSQPKSIRWTSYLASAAFVAIAAFIMLSANNMAQYSENTSESHGRAGAWEEYSPEKLAALQKQGIPVFIDFTAKWCLICQANHLILSTDEVNRQFERLGIVRLKADWTRYDDNITRALKRFGRNSVPLYLIYGSDPQQPPQILPQVLTPEIVISYLNKTKNRSKSPDVADL
jgi:thiol:disulfide interchange protein